MFIASYNPKSIGDVLVVVLRPDTIQQKSEKGNIVRILTLKVIQHQDITFWYFNCVGGPTRTWRGTIKSRSEWTS